MTLIKRCIFLKKLHTFFYKEQPVQLDILENYDDFVDDDDDDDDVDDLVGYRLHCEHAGL